MENYRRELIDLAKAHCALTGKSAASIANSIVKDARFFDRLEEGGGCTVDTYQKVKNWFAKNTPSKNNLSTS